MQNSTFLFKSNPSKVVDKYYPDFKFEITDPDFKITNPDFDIDRNNKKIVLSHKISKDITSKQQISISIKILDNSNSHVLNAPSEQFTVTYIQKAGYKSQYKHLCIDAVSVKISFIEIKQVGKKSININDVLNKENKQHTTQSNLKSTLSINYEFDEEFISDKFGYLIPDMKGNSLFISRSEPLSESLFSLNVEDFDKNLFSSLIIKQFKKESKIQKSIKKLKEDLLIKNCDNVGIKMLHSINLHMDKELNLSDYASKKFKKNKSSLEIELSIDSNVESVSWDDDVIKYKPQADYKISNIKKFMAEFLKSSYYDEFFQNFQANEPRFKEMKYGYVYYSIKNNYGSSDMKSCNETIACTIKQHLVDIKKIKVGILDKISKVESGSFLSEENIEGFNNLIDINEQLPKLQDCCSRHELDQRSIENCEKIVNLLEEIKQSSFFDSKSLDCIGGLNDLQVNSEFLDSH